MLHDQRFGAVDRREQFSVRSFDRVRSDVAIPLPGGGALDGVLALPAGTSGRGWPGVIVLHEVFGPQPEILEVADRFAERGYAALAPDLFSAGVRLACLTYAASSPPGLRAAAINYGQVPADAEQLRGACPVVASYGGRDRVLGAQGERLRKHLTQ